jgi:hypothetical protein
MHATCSQVIGWMSRVSREEDSSVLRVARFSLLLPFLFVARLVQ